VKLKWKVSDAPTGQYRSFQSRSWPAASANGQMVAQILCDDDYTPARARNEDSYGELVVIVTNRNEENWKWLRLKARFATLSEAKIAAQAFFDNHSDWIPKEPA
jgi:hypothetical protein